MNTITAQRNASVAVTTEASATNETQLERFHMYDTAEMPVKASIEPNPANQILSDVVDVLNRVVDYMECWMHQTRAITLLANANPSDTDDTLLPETIAGMVEVLQHSIIGSEVMSNSTDLVLRINKIIGK